MASATQLVQAALFGAALLVMVMLALIIWRQRAQEGLLRAQLAGSEQQAAALRNELEQAVLERDDMKVSSPVEWSTCLSCRSPLPVVLCPHCNAPYHKEYTSPRGVKLACWDAVLQSGRCWNCKGDLSAFRKPGASVPSGPPAGGAQTLQLETEAIAVAVAQMAPPPARPQPQNTPPVVAPTIAPPPPPLQAEAKETPPPLPRVLPPQRMEAPPTEADRQKQRPVRPGQDDDDDDFKIV